VKGSNVKAKVSSIAKIVQNATVIRFHDAPHYRNHSIDISANRALELLEIKPYLGDLRAKVTSATGRPKTCRVIVKGRNFTVLVGYTGSVSLGIEEA